MNLNDICEASAAELLRDEALEQVPVLVESKGDINQRLASDIAKRTLAIVVGWNGFNAESSSSKTIYGTANMTVSIFEQPILNRRREGALTILDAAKLSAQILNLFTPQAGDSPLVFRRIGKIIEIDQSTIACDVEFEVKATL